MEPFIADFINNKKIPRIIRYLIVITLIFIIEYISINIGFQSEALWGNILGFITAISFLIVGLILIKKIYKN